MGKLDKEIKPGNEGLKPCPNCGEQKIGRRKESDLSQMEYYCDECGYKPQKMKFRCHSGRRSVRILRMGKRRF